MMLLCFTTDGTHELPTAALLPRSLPCSRLYLCPPLLSYYLLHTLLLLSRPQQLDVQSYPRSGCLIRSFFSVHSLHRRARMVVYEDLTEFIISLGQHSNIISSYTLPSSLARAVLSAVATIIISFYGSGSNIPAIVTRHQHHFRARQQTPNSASLLVHKASANE
jgi:hypothetical protein